MAKGAVRKRGRGASNNSPRDRKILNKRLSLRAYASNASLKASRLKPNQKVMALKAADALALKFVATPIEERSKLMTPENLRIIFIAQYIRNPNKAKYSKVPDWF